jgi:hypothetical protein
MRWQSAASSTRGSESHPCPSPFFNSPALPICLANRTARDLLSKSGRCAPGRLAPTGSRPERGASVAPDELERGICLRKYALGAINRARALTYNRSGVLSKNTNEDNSGNFHKLLENQLNSLYSYIGGAEYSLTGDLLFHWSSLLYKSLEFPSHSMQPELIFGI